MHERLSMLCVLLWIAVPALAAADEKADGQRVVGSVLGKEITAADIGLKEPIDTKVEFDSRDEARWALMSRINQKFGAPISDRYIREQKIAATAEEIAKFHANSKQQNERQLRALLATAPYVSYVQVVTFRAITP